MPQTSGSLIVVADDSLQQSGRIADAVCLVPDAKYTFRRIEHRCHTERVQHKEYAIHVRYGVAYQGKHECSSPKARSLMQPGKNGICHSVREKAAGDNSGKKDRIVGICHIAAPVHEDEQADRKECEQPSCIEVHRHAPVEPLVEAVFLLIQAEENCQNNEGIAELDQLDGLYHTLVFIWMVITLRHGIELHADAMIEQVIITG